MKEEEAVQRLCPFKFGAAPQAWREEILGMNCDTEDCMAWVGCKEEVKSQPGPGEEIVELVDNGVCGLIPGMRKAG